ncbi:hypothetical protein [Citrobacter sp. U14242]|uniref:hypothetical protein n=1 Tax=Citrobacter sp. U14242 TaxID=3390192 RepID=UPI00397AEF8A
MDSKHFCDIKEIITNAAFGKNRRCFLLIDASLEQYQSDAFLHDIIKDYKSYPVIFHQRELQGALPIFLFPLNSMSERDSELFNSSICHSLNELKSEKLDSGEGRSVCAWISSELTGEQLAEQIALSAVQSIRTVGDILLRYFDPSVFGPLMPLLDSWQKQQLLSNINVWSYIDGDGNAQVVNGDGECKKKLNYSLGLTELNVSEMSRVLVVNKILRVYRKMNVVDKLSECEVVKLLHPALNYFYSSFSPSDNDVIEFGLDVLSAQRLFYQDGVFDKYIFPHHNKTLQSYSEIKSGIDSQTC